MAAVWACTAPECSRIPQGTTRQGISRLREGGAAGCIGDGDVPAGRNAPIQPHSRRGIERFGEKAVFLSGKFETMQGSLAVSASPQEECLSSAVGRRGAQDAASFRIGASPVLFLSGDGAYNRACHAHTAAIRRRSSLANFSSLMVDFFGK